ncbi:hypothetical protein AMECASPLE_036309 [Ameca splendens]|uniref:Secreted protein n=1 Tax=Ameca splendens TaxID=208324 RepID=A0ABV0XWI1_9TELE
MHLVAAAVQCNLWHAKHLCLSCYILTLTSRRCQIFESHCPSPWIIQPGVTSYLCCGDHRLPPTEVSPLGFKFHSRQKQ